MIRANIAGTQNRVLDHNIRTKRFNPRSQRGVSRGRAPSEGESFVDSAINGIAGENLADVQNVLLR
jgi:hypothetical protein